MPSTFAGCFLHFFSAQVDVGEPTYDRCQKWQSEGLVSSSATTTTTDPDAEDGVICWQWNANQPQVIGDGDIIDNCYCFDTSTGGRYCKDWVCNGVEVVNAEYCGYISGVASSKVGSDGSRRRLRRLQSGGCSTELTASTKCSCTQDDRDLEYCTSWSCTITHDGLTYERGVCARAADSGRYCEAWTTETEVRQEQQNVTRWRVGYCF